jgi:hypothetical protein
VDKTATAASQVTAAFGSASPSDFAVAGETVAWTGQACDWGLRRIVLQYAHLCAAACGVPEQPVDFCETAEQRSRANVVADLSSGDEQVNWSSLTVADGVQLGVHAALGTANQASMHPF